MDESFVGWGGEDNEFWERAQGLRVWPWTNLPLIHLWHDAQPGKHRGATQALQRYRALSQVDPSGRILPVAQSCQGTYQRALRISSMTVVIDLVRQNPTKCIHRLWPAVDTLVSLASMGRYPLTLRIMLWFVDVLNRRLPWLAPRKVNWLDRLLRAGSICSAIQKAPSPVQGES
jgi:hypothetical protein